MKKSYYFFILGWVFGQSLVAQDLQYFFTNLNEKDGLRNNIIFSFLKSRDGVLWVGTQNGLNRFDGTHFYTFKKKKDPNSIPSNTINCLCEDTQGNIWGGTQNGIFRFSPPQNKFTHYFAPKDASNNIIANIQCDSKGNVFATTAIELIQYNHQKDEFQIKTRITQSKDSLPHYILGKNTMLIDERNDGFWIASPKGLMFYDNAKNILIKSTNTSNQLFSLNSTSGLSKSPKGHYWFGNNATGEVIAFDPNTKQILKKINISTVSPGIRYTTILEDSEDRLWLSNWNHELFVVDMTNQNKINKLKSKEGNSNALAADFFWAAFEDENGTIWLGTSNGISMCNPGKSVYHACRLPDKIPYLDNSAIYVTEEDPVDKSWWIVTSKRMIINYFPANDKYILYDLDKTILKISGNTNYYIHQIRFWNKQTLLLTSEGVLQLNKKSNFFEPVKLLKGECEKFNITNFIFSDSLLNITNGKQIIQYNPKTYKCELLQNTEENKLPYIYKLLWKPGHKLFWTYFKDSIASLNLGNKIQTVNLIKDKKTEDGGYFHTSDMDNEGNVWVANKGVGLYCYHPNTGNIKHWTEIDGLADNHLHSIMADNEGRIWTIYYNRVSVFIPKENSFSNFIIPYSENKLNYFNNLTKRADGVIMGNVFNDVFEFYPENLANKPMICVPKLSSVSVSGQDYFLDHEDKLSLEPDQNSLRFRFGLLIDRSLYPHEFEYMLEGSDKMWVHSSSTNEANYNNLASGKYKFRFKAKGRNNSWETQERIIEVKIKTPFYKSFLFLSLLFFILATTAYYYIRNRHFQKLKLLELETKSQLLEKEKSIVLYDSLKQQLNPHFLFNSLTSLSGLIDTDQEMAGKFLERMSGIYRYILKNGENETVSLKDELEFVKLYINLQQTRFKKGLLVDIHVEENYWHYKIAPVTLQNLIENAIKHNIIDQDAPLKIEIFIENEYIVVKNNMNKKNNVESSNKKGLSKFISLYKYLSKNPILIEETSQYFIIKVPLI